MNSIMFVSAEEIKISGCNYTSSFVFTDLTSSYSRNTLNCKLYANISSLFLHQLRRALQYSSHANRLDCAAPELSIGVKDTELCTIWFWHYTYGIWNLVVVLYLFWKIDYGSLTNLQVHLYKAYFFHTCCTLRSSCPWSRMSKWKCIH